MNEIYESVNNGLDNSLGKTQKRMNKRQRIPKGQPKMDSTEKLPTQGTQEVDKQNTNNILVYLTPLFAKKTYK